MSRRKKSVKRPVLPDARYDSQTVSKFINALMLAGIAGAAVPLVLHLLSRARYRTVDWGAMMFLESADSRQRQSDLDRFHREHRHDGGPREQRAQLRTRRHRLGYRVRAHADQR